MRRALAQRVLRANTAAEFADAVKVAKANDVTTVIHVETDPLIPAPSSESWWDVPVPEVSELDSTRAARQTYEHNKAAQRSYPRPTEEQDLLQVPSGSVPHPSFGSRCSVSA